MNCQWLASLLFFFLQNLTIVLHLQTILTFQYFMYKKMILNNKVLEIIRIHYY